MGKEQNKSTWFVGILIVILLAGIIAFAVYNNKKTEQAAKAAEEWAAHMKRPWESMEIKTSQDVMRANSMINSSNLSEEEKLKASIWVYGEYAKYKDK